MIQQTLNPIQKMEGLDLQMSLGYSRKMMNPKFESANESESEEE